MDTAVLLLVLLLVLASLASWQFVRGCLMQPRNPSAMLMGGGGAICLVAAVALGVWALPQLFKPAAPQIDLTRPLIAPLTEVVPIADAVLQPVAAELPATGNSRPRVSPGVGKSLSAAQDAIREQQWDSALRHLQQAQAGNQATVLDRLVIAEMMTLVHYRLGNRGQALSFIAQQLDSPGLDEARRGNLLKVAAQLHFVEKAYARATQYASEYLRRDPSDTLTRNVLALSLYLSGDHAGAGSQVDEAIASLRAGESIPTSLVDVKLALAAKNEGPHSLEQVSQELVQNHPDVASRLSSSRPERRLVISPEGATPEYISLPPASAGDALSKDWPATECVRTQARATSERVLLNGCDRPVAVLFAYCEGTIVSCAQGRSGWVYEDDVVLAGGNRNARENAAIEHRIVDAPARVRYLACYVAAVEVVQLLTESRNAEWRARLQEQLANARTDDACLARVSRWAEIGGQTGRSPDALLSDERRARGSAAEFKAVR